MKPARRTLRRIVETAVHECAHVVACVDFFEIERLDYVTIEQGSRSDGCAMMPDLHRTRASKVDFAREAVLALCGGAAEERLTGSWPRVAASYDSWRAAEHAQRAHVQAPEVLEAARTFVREEWPRITMLAAVLVDPQQRRLERAEVAEVLRALRGPPRPGGLLARILASRPSAA